LMMEIKAAKDNLTVSSINAEVMNDYIIPGINGLEVNVEKSFFNMKSFNAFNSYYLVFDQVFPDISLENNKNKIIKKGNYRKRSVSFIVEPTDAIINFFKNNKIEVSILVNLNDYNKYKNYELLNYEVTDFKKLNTLLDKIEQNTKICIVNSNIKEECIKNNYYLVENNKELNGTNIAILKSEIESGDIILIKNNINLEDLRILINQIKYQNLNIIKLSDLITEENN